MLRAEKTLRLRVKSLRVEEKDWRGLLALTITVSYAVLLALRVPGSEMLGVAVGLIVGWYFGERRGGSRTPIKLPRATEKHPEYPAIKARLTEALQASGCYNPAYDDLIIGEIAKTVIDIRTVDRRIDSAETLSDLQKAVAVKARLLEMLEDAVEALAMSRRSRLRLRDAEAVRDTMLTRLKALLKAGEGDAG